MTIMMSKKIFTFHFGSNLELTSKKQTEDHKTIIDRLNKLESLTVELLTLVKKNEEKMAANIAVVPQKSEQLKVSFNEFASHLLEHFA